MATATKYDESSIKALVGLDGVRAKPAYYLGVSPEEHGKYQLLKELVDNETDEAQNGHGKNIGVVLSSKNSTVIVYGHGRGIPVGQHGKTKKSTLEVIFSQLHSGGKLDKDQTGYKKSAGTHGVGCAVVNALTSELSVYSCRDKQWWNQQFSKGKTTTQVVKKRPPALPCDQKLPKSGSVIHYTPDVAIFGKKSKLDIDKVRSWFDIQSYLHAGVTFTLIVDNKLTQYKQENGLLDFLSFKQTKLKVQPIGNPFIAKTDVLDIAIQWTSHAEEDTSSYVNCSTTINGGTHVAAFYKALTEALKAYTGKAQEYKPEDLRFGMTAVLNYSIQSPEFDSQAKSKFVSKLATSEVYATVLPLLSAFFAKNKPLAKEIVEKAVDIRKKTQNFLADKKLVQNVKKAKSTINSKLAGVANSRTPISERELFLIEGDSAGGTAKVARDKNFQATLALKGKPLNVMEVQPAQVLKSLEIANIFAGIGLDLTHKDPISKIEFGKIIILADGDVDGKHINCLVETVFWKYLPQLYERGMVYVVRSPEFLTYFKGKLYFGESKEDVIKKAGTDKIDIVHLKGWGEVSPAALREMAFQKGTRRLYKVTPPDKLGKKEFEALMGKDSHFRKKLLGVA